MCGGVGGRGDSPEGGPVGPEPSKLRRVEGEAGEAEGPGHGGLCRPLSGLEGFKEGRGLHFVGSFCPLVVIPGV